MCLLLFERDDQIAALCAHSGGVVPLEIVRRPVVQVGGLPVGVVTRVERAPGLVELVGEDELVRNGGIPPSGLLVGGGRRVGVDGAEAAVREVGDLAGGVGPADVERAEGV